MTTKRAFLIDYTTTLPGGVGRIGREACIRGLVGEDEIAAERAMVDNWKARPVVNDVSYGRPDLVFDIDEVATRLIEADVDWLSFHNCREETERKIARDFYRQKGSTT